MKESQLYIDYVLILEENNQNGIRLYVAMGAIYILLGVLIFICAPLIAQQDQMKDALRIGGTFLTSLSSLPLKEIIARRDKRKMLNKFRAQLSTALTRDLSEQELDQIKRMVSSAIEKTLA